MKFYRDIRKLSLQLSTGCVATFGNFDGFHVGHQKLIKTLKQESDDLGLPSIAITFSPVPKVFFSKEPLVQLSCFSDKYLHLKEAGVDYLLCLRFNANFARITALQFIEEYLVEALNVKSVVVGYDSRFGAARKGDVHLLATMADQFGFRVQEVKGLQLGDDYISSSRVRTALNKADLNTVETMLGRPFSITGKVAHGEKLGRVLGFPTANLFLRRDVLPMQGVFLVRVSGLDKDWFYGAANLGTRPAVNGTRPLLEVYLFDFNADIYGRRIKVEFLFKLRDEMNFDSMDALVLQIHEDVVLAKQHLTRIFPHNHHIVL